MYHYEDLYEPGLKVKLNLNRFIMKTSLLLNHSVLFSLTQQIRKSNFFIFTLYFKSFRINLRLNLFLLDTITPNGIKLLMSNLVATVINHIFKLQGLQLIFLFFYEFFFLLNKPVLNSNSIFLQGLVT